MDNTILSAAECDDCTKNVCINASQIYDSCRAKECLESLRVYFTPEGQNAIDCASKVAVDKAEVIWIYSDVEALPFHKGYYSVDLKFFFRVEVNAYTGMRRPTVVDGLTCFEKKIVLFGSEGEAKIFQSKYKEDSFDAATWKKTNMPNAVIEVVDPIVLSTTVLTCDDPPIPVSGFDLSVVPECVHRIFDGALVPTQGAKQIYTTLGLFMLARLEREVQITVPAAGFSIPESGCQSGSDDPGSACDMFDDLSFPVNEFFPPRRECGDDNCGCNK